MLNIGRIAIYFLGLALLILTCWLFALRQQEPVPRLLIQSQRDSRYDFYIITLDGTVERQIPSGTLTGLRSLNIQHGWIVYSMYGPGSTLHSVRVTGGLRRVLQADYQILPESNRMRFSQDGRWLAFSGSSQGRGKLLVAPIDGHLPTTLLLSDINWFSDFRVIWSPDNEWLIYNPPGEQTIYRIQRSGGEPEKIADGEMIYATVIERRWMLVQHDGILLVSLDGQEQRILFPQGSYQRLLALRRNTDTDALIVLAIKDNQQDIYRINLNTATRELLFQLPEGHILSTIAPDGKAIIVQDQAEAFYRMPAANLEPQPLSIPALEAAFTFWAEDGYTYFYFFDNSTSGLGFNVARLAPDQATAELIGAPDTGVVTFSPDQTWAILAQYGQDRRSSFLLRKNLQTGEIQPLTDPAYHSDFRAWLPETELETRWGVLLGSGLLLLAGRFLKPLINFAYFMIR